MLSSGRPKELPFVLHARVVTRTGGGPEKTILNSPRLLVPFGYNVLCAYMYPPGDPGFDELRRRAAALDAPLLGIEDRGPLDWRVVRRLLDVCRRHRVTIWHGHDYKSDALGLLLRPLHRMKLVSTAHGFVDYSGRMPLYNKVDLLCLRWYDRVICVSDDVRQACVAAGVREHRCVVIENGIDTRQYSRRTAVAEAKRRLGFDPQRPLVGAVGRLSDEKNFAGLIRAVDGLLREGLELNLLIIGEGPLRPELEGLMAALGRSDCIRLLGYRADMLDLYEAMDVFVLSSLREGLPNVLLEAMALEVPVVATRIAGVPRVVEHERSGLLVEPGSETQLGEALRRLLGDPQLRRRLAAAGRQTIENRYSFERRMEKVRAVYEEVLRGCSHVGQFSSRT